LVGRLDQVEQLHSYILYFVRNSNEMVITRLELGSDSSSLFEGPSFLVFVFISHCELWYRSWVLVWML
jgi:hypothetical protein